MAELTKKTDAIAFKAQYCRLKASLKPWHLDCVLLLCAWYIIRRPRPPVPPTHVVSTLGTTQIFEAWVTWETQVIVPVWVGDWPNQTQTVAYVQWKDLPKYKMISLDIWGWVW